MRLFLRLERAIHMVDAYLAANRGDIDFELDCLSRASEFDRKLAVMRINHG